VNFKKDIWTYLLVTIVTVLIWIWAAGETREQRLLFVSMEFVPTDPTSWNVEPSHGAVTLTVEGSKRALERAVTVRSEPLELVLGTAGVPGDAGIYAVDMAATLSVQEKLRETGVVILASDPPTIELDIAPIVRIPAEIRVLLPGVRTEGEVAVRPEQATVALPSDLRDRWPEIPTVEASVDPSRLERLEQGIEHSIEVALRPPGGLDELPQIRIEPPTAVVTFTIQSRIRQLTLDRVRVQLAGPPESYSEYRVNLQDTVLRNVTVMADGDLIQQIERGEATVVAVVQVSNRDKENQIETKPVTYFVALLGDQDDDVGVFVDAIVDGSPAPPLIHMTITPLPEE
jgi:hypothetical protein